MGMIEITEKDRDFIWNLMPGWIKNGWSKQEEWFLVSLEIEDDGR